MNGFTAPRPGLHPFTSLCYNIERDFKCAGYDPSPFPLKINPFPFLTRITSVGFSDRKAQTIFILRYGDDMHMVWHQAIRPYFNIVPATPFRHKVEIGTVVINGKECLLSPITPLHL